MDMLNESERDLLREETERLGLVLANLDFEWWIARPDGEKLSQCAHGRIELWAWLDGYDVGRSDARRAMRSRCETAGRVG
jgi:hypothetical protein